MIRTTPTRCVSISLRDSGVSLWIHLCVLSISSGVSFYRVPDGGGACFYVTVNNPAIAAVYMTSMTLTWQSTTTATGFECDASTASDFSVISSSVVISTIAASNANLTGLSPNTTYFAERSRSVLASTRQTMSIRCCLLSGVILTSTIVGIHLIQVSSTSASISWVPKLEQAPGPTTGVGYLPVSFHLQQFWRNVVELRDDECGAEHAHDKWASYLRLRITSKWLPPTGILSPISPTLKVDKNAAAGFLSAPTGFSGMAVIFLGHFDMESRVRCYGLSRLSSHVAGHTRLLGPDELLHGKWSSNQHGLWAARDGRRLRSRKCAVVQRDDVYVGRRTIGLGVNSNT